MTPKNPAHDLRDYIDDRLAAFADWEHDGGDDDTPHIDRETLENLSLAVELLDALVACWYAEDMDGASMLAEAAARRLFGWVECTTCNLLFPVDALTEGVCTECADAAAYEADDDRDDDEPCHLGHLDCAPWPDGPCANERRDGRCFTCAEIAPPLNADGDCAQCSAPAPHLDSNPFGGALDR